MKKVILSVCLTLSFMALTACAQENYPNADKQIVAHVVMNYLGCNCPDEAYGMAKAFSKEIGLPYTAIEIDFTAHQIKFPIPEGVNFDLERIKKIAADMNFIPKELYISGDFDFSKDAVSIVGKELPLCAHNDTNLPTGKKTYKVMLENWMESTTPSVHPVSPLNP